MMTTTDFAALSPLLILLGGALVLLLSEKKSFLLTLFFLVGALVATIFAPASHNPLITPWLRFDALAYFFNLFFLSIGIGAALLASSFLNTFQAPKEEYFFLLLAALFGLMLIGAAADFLTLFLGIETLSIALYILCGYMKKWEFSSESALKYFLMGSLAAATLLYGIALVYGATGTTRFETLTTLYPTLAGIGKYLFLGGIALITVALAFEAAVVPFHFWAPDVYDGAPTPVTALMAVGTKVGAFAAFGQVFLIALPSPHPLWNQGIALLAMITLVYANFVALRQTEMRRFFAYSGISHAGFLFLALAAGALKPLLFYLMVYAIATLGAFAVLLPLDFSQEGVQLNDLKGLFKRSPLLAAFLALFLLTLAGIPPTVGFFAKLYLFKAAFEARLYIPVIVALLTTILSAYYYLRIIAVMLADQPEEMASPRKPWPITLLSSLSFVFIIILSWFPALLGYNTSP